MTAVAPSSMTNSVGSGYSNGESGYCSRESPREEKKEMDESDDDVPLVLRKEKAQTGKTDPAQGAAPAPGSFEAALLPAKAKPRPSPSKSSPSVKSSPPWTPMKSESSMKKEGEEDSEDDVPLSRRISGMSANGANASTKRKKEESDEDEDFIPRKKKKEKHEKKRMKKEEEDGKKKKKTIQVDVQTTPSKSGRKKKADEEAEEVWEEERHVDGVKWKTLEHRGPVFAPPYTPMPSTVRFKYNGEVVRLSPEAEEVASFYAKMLDHEYVTKEVFNRNFFKDWRKQMTSAERAKITELEKCDFREMAAYYATLTEERKAMSKEEKLKLKEDKEREQAHYGYAWIDGHKQKIGNFRIEPPGLFRGRGSHPKMGKLKKRVVAEDIIINCSKNSKVPDPPVGHKWKEIRHDNSVTWLCSWTENVLGQNKYIMLNPSSKIKGEKDWEKFETARKLKTRVENIRSVYTADWKSKEMRIRQRAVALYFIDKLALRAGNEKDADEAADTVGCCSIRCEHVKLYDQLDGKEYVVELDFLGKDSIRYFNQVPVEKRVFNNLKLFMEKKDPGDDLFDRLDTASLNQHLQTLMPGLTVKVFRTFNASITLQQQLDKLTKSGDSIHDKILSYNRANRQVAILCNHQRSIPKTHEKSMENLENKIKEKKKELKEAKAELDRCRGEAARMKAKKKIERIKDQLKRLKIQRTDKDENKQIALGTSKLNYLDPRISVAWCKKHNVPIEKVYNKTQREKFRWAIDMTDETYVF